MAREIQQRKGQIWGQTPLGRTEKGKLMYKKFGHKVNELWKLG